MFAMCSSGASRNSLAETLARWTRRAPVRALLVLTGIFWSFTVIAAPVPTVTLGVPAAPFIGENIDVDLTFANTGAAGETGYGPYIDLTFPANGADGGAPDDPDGCTFSNATYLGIPVTRQTFTFPAVDAGVGIGNVEHPYAVDTAGNPLIVSAPPGDQFVVLLLPFGSYTVGQPPAPVTVSAACSDLANLDEALDITANGGFRFGADPLDNPTLPDPSIVGPTVIRQVTPTLILLDKTFIGPEDETATGPSFPRCYQIDVFIAPGQTIQSLDITDQLGGDIQFLRVLDAANIGTSACASENPTLAPTTTPYIGTVPSTSVPGGIVSVNVGAVTPGNVRTIVADLDPATADATLLFEFFVPKQSNAIVEVLPTDSGDDKLSSNQAYAAGNWNPIDQDDDPSPARAEIDGGGDVGEPEHVLEDQAIAVQKGVAVVGGGEPRPGALLRYTLEFQISDYFAFDDVQITDVLSDGQRFCSDGMIPNSVACSCPGGDCTPALSYTEAGAGLAAAAIDLANLTVSGCFSGADIPDPKPGTGSVCDDPTLNSASSPLDGGETVLEFDVSTELTRRGSDALLLGGCVPGGGGDSDCTFYVQSESGPTIGTLVFYAEVQEAFSDNPPGDDTGDLSVDHGDVIVNDADIDGRVLNTTDLSIQSCTMNVENPLGECHEADDTHTSRALDFGSQDKLIYAIGGSVAPDPDTGFPDDPNDPNDGPQLIPGEVVTYQISYTLPFTDFENLRLSDYLPLPILDATGLAFDPARPRCRDYTEATADPLAAGVVCFKTLALAGESTLDTFLGYALDRDYSLPGDFLTIDADSNSAEFDFGSFDHPHSLETRIVLLLSVPASSEPFADNLFLTNQLRVAENSTNGGDLITDDIVQIRPSRNPSTASPPAAPRLTSLPEIRSPIGSR